MVLMLPVKRNMAQFMFSIMLAALTVYHSDSANTTVVTRLRHELLNNTKYDPAVRPTNDSDLPLVVECAFVPILHHVEIINQEIKLRGRMVMSWVDERLRWDPEDYDGINRLHMKVAEIWIPDLTVYEGISTDSEEGFKTETNFATISYTGEVEWGTMATSRSFCVIDVRYFPHDEHKCYMTFTPLAYPKTEVHLNQDKALLGNYTYKDYEVHNAEWEMNFMENDPEKTNYVECDYCLQNFSSISYIVSVKRVNPFSAYFTFVFPCLLLAYVSSGIGWFPSGSVEAPSFGLACCLALTVFLMSLYNMLPGTGFCLLGHLIVTLLYIVSFETILAAFSILSHRRDLRKPGTDEQEMRRVGSTRYHSLGQTQQNDTPTTSQSSDVPTDSDRESLISIQGAKDTVPTTYGFYSSKSCLKKLFVIFNLMKGFSLILYVILSAN